MKRDRIERRYTAYDVAIFFSSERKKAGKSSDVFDSAPAFFKALAKKRGTRQKSSFCLHISTHKAPFTQSLNSISLICVPLYK
jgi:hypothetical protein